MIETDKVSEIISKHRITPTQVYLLWLLYTEDTINLKKYIEVFGAFKREDLEDLELKGLLIWTNREALSYRTTDLVVTLEFVEELGKIDPEEAYDELFDVYPDWLLINESGIGKKIPAKSLNFPDEKSAREFYKNIVSKNKFIHQKILSAVNKYKEDNNGYAIVKIDKFLTGRLWEALEKQEDDRAKPRIY